MCHRLSAIARVACLLTAQTACLQAIGAEGDVFTPYAGLSFFRDDNLFRVPDGASLLGARSDTIRVAFAGVSFDKLASRQRFRGDVSYSSSRYGRYSFLDYDAPKIRLGWDWVVGNLWSGTVTAQRTEALTDFSDFQLPIRNITTTRNAGFSANFRFHPDWTFQFGDDVTSSRNDTRVRKGDDFDGNAWFAGLSYQLKSGNRIGLRLSQLRGKYPERVVGVSDNRFTQTVVEGRGMWAVSAASRFDLRLGQTTREHPTVTRNDFSGLTGALSYDWIPTEKSQVNLLMRRDIEPYETLLSTWADVRAVSVAPKWFPTAKTSLQFRAEFLNRDIGGLREDRSRIFDLTFLWVPLRELQTSLGVRHDIRTSSERLFGYTDTTWSASAQVGF